MHDKDTVLQPLTAPAPAPRPKPIPHPSPSELESASRTGWAGIVFHMDFATSGCRRTRAYTSAQTPPAR